MTWNDLGAAWPAFSPQVRRGFIVAMADTFRMLWQSGADLEELPPAAWLFRMDGPQCLTQPPGALLIESSSPAPVEKICGILAAWRALARPLPGDRACLRFLITLLRPLGLRGEQVRFAARTVERLCRKTTTEIAGSVYLRHLEGDTTPAQRPANGLVGVWRPSPTVHPLELEEAIRRLLADPAAEDLKRSRINRVVRGCLFGRDVVVKQYLLTRPAQRFKYRWRQSRARRAWAAGLTMQQLGIGTPEPLGLLEVFANGVATECFVITCYIEDAIPAYYWVRERCAPQDGSVRRRFASDLRREFEALYDAALYHGDMKLTNILLQYPDDAERRRFLWTDLESMLAGLHPGRHRMIRNLVQLNGSLGTWVPQSDRLRFIARLARRFPWLRRRATLRRMDAWTQRRLNREDAGTCGP